MSATADPISQANAALSELIASTAAPKRRGTLLIVDDEEGPRMSLRVIFKDNFDLLMAEDGPTAIELAQKHDIDVAILDIRMAGMSGIEVLERLRFVRPEIEAIMITAFETTDTIRQALRLRACDYINKPFDMVVHPAKGHWSGTLANALQFHFSQLSTLAIAHTQVTDAGIRSLRDLKMLTSLNLDHTQVTDAGPATLPPMVAVFEAGKPTPITPPISATCIPPVVRVTLV